MINVLDEDVEDTEDSSGITGIIDKDDRINTVCGKSLNSGLDYTC